MNICRGFLRWWGASVEDSDGQNCVAVEASLEDMLVGNSTAAATNDCACDTRYSSNSKESPQNFIEFSATENRSTSTHQKKEIVRKDDNASDDNLDYTDVDNDNRSEEQNDKDTNESNTKPESTNNTSNPIPVPVTANPVNITNKVIIAPNKDSKVLDYPPPTTLSKKTSPLIELKEFKKQTISSSATTADNTSLIQSPLMGSIFIKDNDNDGFNAEVGDQSIHFEKNGCYVSYDHSYYSDSKLKDGTVLPSHIFFKEQTFDSNKRQFKGVIEYGGNWDGYVSESYVLKFDTQFLCVLSGRVVLKRASDGSAGSDFVEIFGRDASYINVNLHNVDVSTEKRLREEGASKKIIHSFKKHILQLREADKRAKIENIKAETEKKQAEYAAEDFTYSKFEEITKGYFYSTRWVRNEKGQYKLGEERTVWIDMSKPRECSYERWNNDTKQNDTISLHVPSANDISTPPPVEYRAITLRQLLAVAANIKRRCVSEGWKNNEGVSLTPDMVTLYDCNKYVILPFTESAKQSFVSCLPSTAGPQLPRWFASHWWGEPVVDFIRCLEQHMRDFSVNGYRPKDAAHNEDDKRGGGLTMDTPIWICAYSNNQHKLAGEIPDDPNKSGFTRAMQIAEGRTITILDKHGVVFTRIWCAYELYLTLISDHVEGEGAKKLKEGIWAIYTAKDHIYKYNKFIREKREAVGVISGGAPVDLGIGLYTPKREEHFPFQLMKQSLTVKVETAEASKKEDRIHILNSIRGNGGDDINVTPPASDRKYTEVNDAVQAGFISSVPSLRAALAEDEKTWESFLLAMSKGKKDLRLTFDFNEGWDGLTAEQATQLILHLPLTTVSLSLRSVNFGVGFTDAVSKHVSETSQLDFLGLYNIFLDGDDSLDGAAAAVRLAEVIGSNISLTTINLDRTNVLRLNNLEQWGSALKKNNTLTTLRLFRIKDKYEIQRKLKEITKHRTPKLDIKK